MSENNELKIEDTLDQGRSQYYQCELPTGMIVDGELHRTALIREITGNEEDLLATMNAKTLPRVLQNVIERCVVQIGTIKQTDPNWSIYIKNLLSTDRMYLLIQMRIASLGREYSYRIQCPECGKLSNQTVDLNDFEITGLKDPMVRVWEGKLPSGKKFKAQVQTSDKEIKGLDPRSDVLTYTIMQRLIELDGRKPIASDVKGLSARDRAAFRGEIHAHEGKIDNSVEMVCPSCSAEFSSEISISEVSFFFPSGI